jgi:branched-chain amino acid transport system substrate-binding protein
MEDVPMIQKIKQFNANHHPEVTFRPNSYMQGFVTGMIFVECLKRADRAGQLNSDGLVKALKSLKGFETGGLTAPLTIKNNRFPVARIWQASVEKGIFEPAPLPKGLEHWIRIGY